MNGAVAPAPAPQESGRGAPLDRAFFDRPATEVAPDLLGLVLWSGATAIRIVETEAYEPDDPASHSFIGLRPRTRSMFGPPGHLYVYRSYGIHWCANVVCSPEGVGAAVLVRAGEPVAGVDLMAVRRAPATGLRQLCTGPGKLCAALGIAGDDDGADLCRVGENLQLAVPLGAGPGPGPGDWLPPGGVVVQTARIGISKAADRPWRWLLRGNPYVSRPAPAR